MFYNSNNVENAIEFTQYSYNRADFDIKQIISFYITPFNNHKDHPHYRYCELGLLQMAINLYPDINEDRA